MVATALTSTRTRKEWAAEINQAWQKSINSILDTAAKCLGAFEELGVAEFEKMAEAELDFSPRMAKNLKKIADNPALMDQSRRRTLPIKWAVLAELAPMTPQEIAWAEARGLINKETTARGARALVSARTAEPGEVIGQGKATHMLPSKGEARKPESMEGEGG